jgi:polyferredoxin
MLKALRRKRGRLQSYTWIGLPLVIFGGWFFPNLGFFLLMCMIGANAIAIYKGRAWCDWMCPRGSFYDLFLKKVSAQRDIPAFFRDMRFRLSMLAVLLGVLGSQVYFAWGDLNGWPGHGRVLTVTTATGLLLGTIFHQRIWCHICPMGTISNYLSEGKQPLDQERLRRLRHARRSAPCSRRTNTATRALWATMTASSVRPALPHARRKR